MGWMLNCDDLFFLELWSCLCPAIDFGYSVEGQNPPFTRNTYPGSNYFGGSLNGGIAHPVNPALGVRNVRPDYPAQFGDSAYFPPSTSPVQTPEFPIWIGMDEGTSYVGHCGYIDFIRNTYGMTNQAMNMTKTRAFIGNNTPASWKLSIPWDGATYCGTGQSRTGVIF